VRVTFRDPAIVTERDPTLEVDGRRRVSRFLDWRVSFLPGLVILHPEGLADDRNHGGVVDQPVEDRASNDRIGEHLAPGFEALVSGHAGWPARSGWR
jgi:hypothetical protein